MKRTNQISASSVFYMEENPKKLREFSINPETYETASHKEKDWVDFVGNELHSESVSATRRVNVVVK